MEQYDKKALDTPDLLALLKQRGLQVSDDFGLPQHEFLISWMESLTSLRNFCAHHSRVWNRRYALKPQMPKTLAGHKWITNFSFPPDKIYPQLCCIAYLLGKLIRNMFP